MIIRHEMTIVVTLLALSLAVGLIGILADNRPTTYVGILAAFATAPAAVCTYIRRTQRAAATALARAEIDGYRLALEHVARGLLDPDPGTQKATADSIEALRERLRILIETEPCTDDTAWGGYTNQSHRGNVFTFRPIRNERQAQ